MAALKSTAGAMRELALFAGAGGGILGGKLLGWRCVCAVEQDSYAASVLVARQNDGSLDPFPIWDDVRTFDGRPWRGGVDIISGGFPCQDISVAGAGKGIDGERSGLWSHMARIVGEVRPMHVLVENSPALTSRGLGRVLGDLAALGYDAEWGVLGACDAGAPHRRERIWIAAADSDGARQLQPQGRVTVERGWLGDMGGEVPDPERARLEGAAWQGLPGARRQGVESAGACREISDAEGASDRVRVGASLTMLGSSGSPVFGSAEWWHAEPGVGRVVDGVARGLDAAERVERLKCLGNGQVPATTALAWRELAKRGGWL